MEYFNYFHIDCVNVCSDCERQEMFLGTINDSARTVAHVINE